MRSINLDTKEPHARTTVLVRDAARAPESVLIILHGRGSTAHNIMSLTEMFRLPEHTAVLAPQAVGQTWYPRTFLVPQHENEPYLSSALHVIDKLFTYCSDEWGVESRQIVLSGFSQGACLSAEYAVKHPMRYKGLAILSGGIIGSEEDLQTAQWRGDFEETPVYVGCDKRDPHIPETRVNLTAGVFEHMNAAVTKKLYTHIGHRIHPDGLEFLEKALVTDTV